MDDEENRIARNSEVLNKTEAEIATLETEFVRLQELQHEAQRLHGEAEKAKADETALLADESLSEKDAMKRLGELRIRLDVLNARVAGTEGKIKAQTAELTNRSGSFEEISTAQRRINSSN